jgi:hypothetical protein
VELRLMEGSGEVVYKSDRDEFEDVGIRTSFYAD